ncbi:SIR2 family protein [Myxococcus sp. SDU36]|uniref:SIR2 family protein n=1 Tax=Myxococcus sp. SDU36 TaxID=2831967 RepID=UPI002543C599|nr:SIR2 family protein [Myxococcus sp. SDU36]WIG97569.1 SIR2 family protein [Myxococcus sp. SDU36]
MSEASGLSIESEDEGPQPASSTRNSFEDRLERLSQRIMDGLCVPFLGAGISLYAPPKSDHKSTAPTIKATEIATNLAQALFKKLPPSSASTSIWQQNLRRLGLECSKLDENGNQIIDKNPDKKGKFPPKTPSLGEVAELCWSILTPIGTCEVLRLEEWNQRLPTAAHHYLAALVREGLVTEILETNYDEFVEASIIETFGAEKIASTATSVISDLGSYRTHIATPRKDREHESLAKVVKLNGCASAYSRSLLSPNSPSNDHQEAARRIILTEEQLQNWGNKHWARELLNDRVRSQTLLFIGFGNADPIVRHHSVQVIREFQENAPARSGLNSQEQDFKLSSRNWKDHNNAPFIAAYERDLSFHQYQLLRAFRDAHATPPADSHKAKLDHIASIYENSFLGDDSRHLIPENTQPPEGLTADLFLETLAARCICRLATERWFGRESPLHSYLQGALRNPRTILAEICNTLFTGNLDNPPLFSRWISLQSPTCTEQDSSPWALACFALRHVAPGRAGYRPFLDSPIKQPMFIVLLALSASRDAKGILQLPSSVDLARRSRPELANGESSSTKVPPAYQLITEDRLQGVRRVLVTSDIDKFIDHEREALSYGDNNNTSAIPDHSVVIGLGRGNLTGAFRQQIWVKVRSNPTPSTHSNLPGSAHPQQATSPATSVSETRVVREFYVVGDLAAVRGGLGQSVDLVQAQANIKSLSKTPEFFLDMDEGWRKICRQTF